METAVNEIIQAILFILQVVPIGTNLGLARLLWAMVSGSFLSSRGAIHSGLSENEFTDEEVRRSWSAMRYGSWRINELLEYWQAYVAQRNEWRVRRFGQYRVKSVDITGFWRPRLAGKVSQHYHELAQKALPAIVVGVMISSGEIRGKRVPLLQAIVRCEPETGTSEFRRLLLQATVKQQASDEITVVDAEFELSELHDAQLQRFVVRLANNCTARLNHLPQSQGKSKGRRRQYGVPVRPLPRTYRKKTIVATAAQAEGTFQFAGRTIRFASWQGLVTSETKVNPDNPTFAIHVLYDPLYKKPLVLATDVALAAELIYLIYRERWPVEHPPLAAKQMIGLHRQFVSAPESRFRLPELALLAGNLLTHVAAILPPVPSGFWDRLPKATPGRLRRLLARAIFPNLTEIQAEFRKKNSVFDHLPKGIDAHRRQKAST
jgi:hypothetical protein